ncbi:MAG: hypothetical protein HDS43_00260 [Bacteroides sp.]|nr:hypothetical protein [Bacteroides sp.]
MKKVVFSLAVLFSMAMVSCGSKEAAATDSDTVVAVEETVTDSIAVEPTSDSTANVEVAADTTVAAAEEPAK